MPRALRLLHPGAWYHVTARGIERRPIFKDARDRSHFLELLAELVDRFDLRLHTFVLMDNHYHLLIALRRPNLSRAIQWLNVSYSVWFNRRHQRSGYLFQGRFKSILVDPRRWGLGLSAYLHLNPARVGRLGLGKSDRQRARAGAGSLPARELVRQRLSTLRTFRWSSYRAYLGLEDCPAWLDRDAVLELGGGPKSARQENYRKYVENQVREGLPEKPWEAIRDQILLGGARFAAEVKKHAAKTGQAAKPGQWSGQLVSWEEVTACVEKARAGRWEDFKDKHGDRGRDQALHLARRTTGLTVSELAQRAGLKQGANVSMSVKRYQKLIDQNETERKLAAKAAKMLLVTL